MRKKLAVLLICCLFIAESISYGAVPWVKYSYFKNYGGLNDNLSTTEIADNEATDLQNVIFDVGGAVKKRNGYSNWATSSSLKISTGSTQYITGISGFKRTNGTASVVTIIANDDAVLAYARGYQQSAGLPNSNWMEITPPGGGLPNTGQTANDLVNFTTGEDTLIFTMPARTPIKPYMYQATGSAAILTNNTYCPTASLCCYHKNQLFLAGNTTNPSRVYFSNLGDIKTYTATDFFDVETNDGTQVRALISAYDSLYIFKDNSIWRLSGTNRDDFVLQLMVKNAGTLSFNSVKLLKDGILFVTQQGDIAAYDGGYNVVFLSSKIRNTIGALNFNRAAYSAAAAFSTYRYNDYDYYCSVSTAGKDSNDEILVFDAEKKAWTKFAGMTASTMAVVANANGQDILFWGDNQGHVFYYPNVSYWDNDTATASINAFYQTKWFLYSENALASKVWRRCKPYFVSESAGSTVTVECKSDYEATGSAFTMDLGYGSSLWDSAIFDVSQWSGQSLVTKLLEVEKGSSMFQVKVSNNNLSEGFTLLGFENFIEPTTGGV